MRRILLLTHFDLAKGAYSTLSYFFGEQALIDRKIVEISAYSEGHEQVDEELAAFWASITNDDQVIICTDIMGGSVNQKVVPYLQRPNTYIFSGFNFPLLLQLLSLPEDASEKAILDLERSGKEGLICMNTYVFPTASEEDE